jgi:hypothetical protein
MNVIPSGITESDGEPRSPAKSPTFAEQVRSSSAPRTAIA